MRKQMTNFSRDEEGATAIEYGLIAALVSLAAFGAIIGLANSINQLFNYVSSDVNNAVTP